MSSFRIALRVLRTDARTRTSALLIAVGVAFATALVLLLVSLPGATQERADRAAWQLPAGHTSAEVTGEGGTVEHAAGVDVTPDGREIQRVDVAALVDPADVPLPAGIDRLPAPGEALVSPELAALLDRAPGSQLGDRYGEVTGTLGQDALAYPEQLVVLVGHEQGDMPAAATSLAGFGDTGTVDPMLSLLAGVGVVVLTVPSLVLIASAARLIAARREQRLAVFRLAGATPRQVVSMVAAETVLAAAAGALLGLAASPLLYYAATFVPWDGGTWHLSDFGPGVPTTLAVLVGVPYLVLVAAVLGLNRVLSTPLGAVGGHTPKRLHWWRLLPLPLSGLVFAYLIAAAQERGVDASVILLSMALIVVSINLTGPWITALVGRMFRRSWRRPSGLLAGSRLTDDPRGAYRATAGVVLAVFTGAMALTLMPSLEASAGAPQSFRDGVQYVDTTGAEAERIADGTDARLAQYGQTERAAVLHSAYLRVGDSRDAEQVVTVADCGDANRVLPLDLGDVCADEPAVYSTYPLREGPLSLVADPMADAGTPLGDVPVRQVEALGGGSDGGSADGRDTASTVVVDSRLLPDGPDAGSGVGSDEALVTVAVPSTAANGDIVRTALVAGSGGEQVQSREVRLAGQENQLADLRRVTVIGLSVAALLGGCSAAITTAGSVLDRRRTFGALIAAGTPVRVLTRALRAESGLPAFIATAGAGVAGVLVGVGFINLVDDADNPVVVFSPWLAAPLVLGVAVALIASSVCRPALNRVRQEPLADE
ncbi:hypothetical protein BJF85_18620 [Saccharomonospora sp. CUA-673]|uniref:FtsX-like permease family protein n=1 Tax=Saccharomonospora sp. CUA-673 TaxID=1904969 RepID=UPI0009666595|nr:FtsX-like permease family protein [Saccharomonospora sp. CUA-673]OLT45509.1 hypothetical protein BJF85_18620 [Saccharomonospora sp. CUA-673]